MPTENCKFVVSGKVAKAFVAKYHPSIVFEINSDVNVSLIIEYETLNNYLTRLNNIEVRKIQTSNSFNVTHIGYLSRHIISDFYGIKFDSESSQKPKEDKETLRNLHGKFINHLEFEGLLTHPVSADKEKALFLLRGTADCKANPREITLLQTVHSLEFRLNALKTRSVSPTNQLSISRMRSITETIKKTIKAGCSDLELSKLHNKLFTELNHEITINYQDMNRFSRFFSFPLPEVLQIYNKTLTLLIKEQSHYKKPCKRVSFA